MTSWIKMRTNLDTDPRVIAMAAELGVHELHVVGCLWKVWAWADGHTLDGNAIRVTDVTLDRFTCVTGFAAALRKVGWLEGRDSALTFPRFAEHNGQTAKKRGETALRVAKSRNAKRVTDVTQKVLPDKRREEKRRELGGKPPNTSGDKAAFDEAAIPEDIRTAAFVETWRRWIEYRRGLGKAKAVTVGGQEAAFRRVREVGVAVAVAKLEKAMANNYQGWDFDGGQQALPAFGPGQTYDPEAEARNPNAGKL